MQNLVYIAKLSGGKDSTAMCDLLLKHKYPLDYIVFCDTLAEFGEMYDYLGRVKEYFANKYNFTNFITTKPKVSIDDILFMTIGEKSKNSGKIKGAFLPQMGFCDWRLYSKMHPQEAFIKELGLKKSQIRTYLGITIDEQKRCNRNDKTLLYPLVDDFKMSESDCKEYLISQNMENPLYRHFTRTGCAFCPAQSKKAKFNLWKHYPQVWRKMKQYENQFLKIIENGGAVYNPYWFNDKPLSEYEKEFEKQDNQKQLFSFDDEPLKDCFCKF